MVDRCGPRAGAGDLLESAMRRLSFALAILCLHAIAGAAGDALRSQIETMDKAVHIAVLNRDIGGFESAVKAVVTKNFTSSFKGKASSLRQMVGEMKRVFDAIPKMTSEDSILLSLVKHGDTATCTTMHKIKGVSEDDSGTSHHLFFFGTSVDTYRKVNGKWRMSSMVWRTRQLTMDDKPMKISASATGVAP